MLSNALSQTMHQHDLEDDLLDLLVEYNLIEKLLQECSVPFLPCHVLQRPVTQCLSSVLS